MWKEYTCVIGYVPWYRYESRARRREDSEEMCKSREQTGSNRRHMKLQQSRPCLDRERERGRCYISSLLYIGSSGGFGQAAMVKRNPIPLITSHPRHPWSRLPKARSTPVLCFVCLVYLHSWRLCGGKTRYLDYLLCRARCCSACNLSRLKGSVDHAAIGRVAESSPLGIR